MIFNEEEIYSMLLRLFYDYVELHPTHVSIPSFEEDMIESVSELLLFSLNEDEIDCILYDFVDIVLPMFYDGLYPRRSYSESIIIQFSSVKKDMIKNKISYLTSLPQPEQRTTEWYDFRRNLITASNAYKIFESPAQQNSLIYEKCTTNAIIKEEGNIIRYVNTDSPLHWGQKYEPLSLSVYEQMYNTKVGEFGCIQHNIFSFIGASPDGINIDPLNDRYGRMLEIKNIVNREITGVPKKEHWIQMQLQMESCDLDECDFVETRFIEYENEREFLTDSDSSLFTSINGEKKGIILYFFNNTTGAPLYIYAPLQMSYSEYDIWSSNLIEEMLNTRADLTWVRHIYWRLDELSCILVTRNKKWFSDVVPIMGDFWKIIERERITGYEHRAPTKRVPKTH